MCIRDSDGTACTLANWIVLFMKVFVHVGSVLLMALNDTDLSSCCHCVVSVGICLSDTGMCQQHDCRGEAKKLIMTDYIVASLTSINGFFSKTAITYLLIFIKHCVIEGCYKESSFVSRIPITIVGVQYCNM